MVTLLTVRGDTVEADLDVFCSFVSQAGLQDYVLSFFVPVDRVSDEHKGKRNNDEAG